MLARIAPCGHVAPIGGRCPECGTTPAEKAESKRKRSKQSYIDVYSTPRWKQLRLKTLRRFGFQCQYRYPGCTGKATHAAHIHPFTSAHDPQTWDEANLTAACSHCNSSEASQRWHTTQGHTTHTRTA